MRTIGFNDEDIKECKLALANQNITPLQSAFLLQYINNIEANLDKLEQEIERLNKENEYLTNKHEKIIHNIMEFVDKNTFNHRNTGDRILTLHGKGILDLLDICLGSDKE